MLDQLLARHNGLADGLWGTLPMFTVGVVLHMKGGD